MSGEQAASTILPLAIAQISTAFITAGFGIAKELHYVSSVTMILNIVGLFFIVGSVDYAAYTFPFAFSLCFFVLGFVVVVRDIHHKHKNEVVAFLLGSKTVGAIGIWVGFIQNQWIDVFVPLANVFVIEAAQPASGLLVQIVGLAVILSTTHILGAFFWIRSKMRYG